MSEMATEKPVPDWRVEPPLCKHCRCSWHGLECPECFCGTSCLAPTLIVPAHIELGDN